MALRCGQSIVTAQKKRCRRASNERPPRALFRRLNPRDLGTSRNRGLSWKIHQLPAGEKSLPGAAALPLQWPGVPV